MTEIALALSGQPVNISTIVILVQQEASALHELFTYVSDYAKSCDYIHMTEKSARGMYAHIRLSMTKLRKLFS